MFDNRRNILVKIREEGDNLISLQTYDRANGKSMRFLICRDKLVKHDFSEGDFYDSDCGNILRMYFTPHTYRLTFEILWISDLGEGEVHGRKQYFSFDPGLGVLNAMQEGMNRNYLYIRNKGRNNYSVTFAESAMRNVGEIRKNRKDHRAFLKAMARCFQWPDTHTTVYADGHDFYFRTNDGLCGGLIRHEHAGKVMYSIHT